MSGKDGYEDVDMISAMEETYLAEDELLLLSKLRKRRLRYE